LVRVHPGKLRKIHTLYEGLNQRLEAFLAENPEAELQTVATFFSRVNALRTER